MTETKHDLETIAGISPEYARLLESADITSLEKLRLRLSTDQDRRLVSWQTGIAEPMLLKWFQQSFDEYDPSQDPGRVGVSSEEAAMLGECVEDNPQRGAGLIAPDGALPLHTTDGRRVQDGPLYRIRRRVAHLRVFTVSTTGVLLVLVTVLLLGYFSDTFRGESSNEPLLGTASNAEVRARFATNLFQEGKVKEAETEFRQALLLEPDNVSARTGLGRALLRQNRLEDAEAQLRRAIDYDPNGFEAHYYLSTVLIQRNDLEGAVASARSALDLLPDHPWAAYNLGLASHLSNRRFQLTENETRLAVSTLIQELETTKGPPSLRGQTVAVLRSLTGKEFGFESSGDLDSQARAVRRWADWWSREQTPGD